MDLLKDTYESSNPRNMDLIYEFIDSFGEEKKEDGNKKKFYLEMFSFK